MGSIMSRRGKLALASLLAALATTAQATGLREEIEAARPGIAGIIDSRLVVIADQYARRTSSPARLATTETERALTDTSLVQRNAAGAVSVRITSDKPALLVDALEALGATDIIVVPHAYLLECYIPESRIADLAGLVDIGLGSASATFKPISMVGAVTSQADIAMQAERVRLSVPGYNGAGVRIGCLSDSYNALGGAAAGVVSGDVPVVTVLADLAGQSDEGRAMIELMYDLAPGSTYAFATAFSGGEATFAANVTRLANPVDGNCDVIVDDVVNLAEPYFQNSLVGQAVNAAVNTHDVVYFTSAGNQDTDAWERTGLTTGVDATFGTCLDFDPGGGTDLRQRFVLASGSSLQLALQWDDPYYTATGVDTDIDMRLVNSTAPSTTIASSVNNNIALDTPFELLQYTNNSGGAQNLDLILQRFAGPTPGRIKYISYTGVIASEFHTNSPTMVSHAAAERGCGVGAINYYDQFGFASFTSLGPSTILFNDNGTLKGAPEVRQTPTLSAVQATNTTFFGGDAEGDGFPNFFGSSAAAPHAAAIAALVRQRNPAFNRDQVIAAMIAACDNSVGTPGFDNITGNGTLNGYKAVFGNAVATTPPVSQGAESGALPIAFTQRSSSKGRILLTTGNTPAVGTRHITMDTYFNGGFPGIDPLSLNEVDLHLNLTGYTNVQLSFRQKESNDFDDPMSASFTTRQNADGVAYSVNGGTTWKRITSLTGANSTNTYTLRSFNLSTLATTNGDVLGSDVRIRFQQYDEVVFSASGGMAFDDIQVTGTAPGLNGDANNDGTINASDATAVYNFAAGIGAAPSGDGDVVAPFGGAGQPNTADANAIVQFIVNGVAFP